jgi:hypothetical protein
MDCHEPDHDGSRVRGSSNSVTRVAWGRMRPPHRRVWHRISGTAPRAPTIQPMTSALESYPTYRTASDARLQARNSPRRSSRT